MRSATARVAIALSAWLVYACASPAPPPAQPSLPPVVAPVPLPPPPAAPLARWVETGSLNDFGFTSTAGTPIVLGGRRALIVADGTLKVPATPMPEPIEELIEVFTPKGRVLAGRGVNTIYRFDDILAEPKVLAHSAVPYRNIDPGPGVIAAWTLESSGPTFVDVETGRETKVSGLPSLPMASLSFSDEKSGAAIFAVAGLAVTSDGGATWRPVVDPDGGALTAKALAPRDGEIEARADDDGSERRVDTAAATLGPPTKHPPPGADAPAIERWLARTHRDPLEVAVSDGVGTPAGDALIASQGLVAKVDLQTGAVLELADLGDAYASKTCTIARGGGKAWVACANEGREAPVRLWSFPLGDAPLETTPPQSIGTTTDLRWSAGGGVMLVGPCRPGGDGNACVLQPDGKWRTLDAPASPPAGYESYGYGTGYYGYYSGYSYGSTAQAPIAYGLGPLADGGVAYVTVFHDDTPPEASDAGDAGDAAPAYPGYYYGSYTPPPPPRFQIVIIEGGGMHRRLPPLDFGESKATGRRVLGAVEEDAEHTLRAVFQDSDGPIVVTQPQAGDPSIARVEGVKAVRLHGLRGIAIGKGTLSTSSDGGATWSDLGTPPHVFATTGAADQYVTSPTAFEASDVGFHLGGHLRIGWGDLDPSDATLTASPPEAYSPTPPPPPPARHLECATTGTSDAVVFTSSYGDFERVLAVAAPPTGVRRQSTRWSGALGGIATLDFEGPDSSREPTKWRLTWVDYSELGAHARSWTGASPKGAGAYGSVLSLAAAGDRVAALVRMGERGFVVRATSGGAGDIVEVPIGSAYSAQIVIGPKPGDPAAWLIGPTLFALSSKGAVHALASFVVDPRIRVTLGKPTASGVPVYANAGGWGVVRSFALDGATYGATSSTSTADIAALPATLDGWSAAPSVLDALASAPVCGGKSTGTVFRVFGRGLDAQVDGAPESPNDAEYEAKISASGICLGAVTEALYTTSYPPPSTSNGHGPISFLRADVAAKRAEGAMSGARARRFECKLVTD